jgi:hypothetical protein
VRDGDGGAATARSIEQVLAVGLEHLGGHPRRILYADTQEMREKAP